MASSTFVPPQSQFSPGRDTLVGWLMGNQAKKKKKKNHRHRHRHRGSIVTELVLGYVTLCGRDLNCLETRRSTFGAPALLHVSINCPPPQKNKKMAQIPQFFFVFHLSLNKNTKLN